MVGCIHDTNVVAEVEHVAMDYLMLLKDFKDATVMSVGRKFVADAHQLVGICNVLGSRYWYDLYLSDVVCNLNSLFMWSMKLSLL